MRLLRHDSQAGLISILLALGGGIGLALSSISTSLDGEVDARILALALIAGVVTVLVGGVLWLRERKLESYQPSRSFGLLYIGVGFFVSISAIMLPTIPVQLHTPPTVAVTATITPTRTLMPTRTPLMTFTPTGIPTATTTPTPLPTLTLTPTRPPLLLPTRINQTATSASNVTNVPQTPSSGSAVCTVTVLQNVNLRSQPTTESARIITIPFDTVLNVSGKSTDGQWWQVRYENQAGWVSAEFVQPGADCGKVPVVQP
ncbi:MAG: SH3 domain-containing protein [Anaerolineae bacterium]